MPSSSPDQTLQSIIEAFDKLATAVGSLHYAELPQLDLFQYAIEKSGFPREPILLHIEVQ